MLEGSKSDLVLDARGKYCPEPITMTAKKMREEVQVGKIVEVWAEDDAAMDDFTRWCKRTGHELLGYIDDASIEIKLPKAKVVRKFFIKKTHQ